MYRISLLIFSLILFVAVAASAEEFTKIGDIQRGMPVSLKGEVTRITDEDEFRLRDDTGSVLIYIGWRNRVMVKTGETVIVRGFVDDDLQDFFRPEVYAQEIVRENGEVIRLR